MLLVDGDKNVHSITTNNILVISYFFPPFKRVGGRRWAKHVKYMNRAGINTFVLTREFPNSISAWDSDIIEYKEKITRVRPTKNDQPFFKTKLPDNVFEKIRWKLSLYKWRLKRIIYKGNYNDISAKSGGLFFTNASRLILKNKIGVVILSVGPFRYSEILISLKRKFPHLKIVIDYRDKWEDGYFELNTLQKKNEDEKQMSILKVVDLAITVNDDISNHLKKLQPGLQTFVLPHCIDEDFYAISLEESSTSSPSETDRFIYGGELYHRMEKEIDIFVRLFEKYKVKKNKAEASFYLPYKAYSHQLNMEGVELLDLLPREEYQQRLYEADVILLFRPNWSSEAFSSKFFEILCMRKPILYFGNSGAVSDFLIQNNLGFHVCETNIDETVKKIIENGRTKIVPDIKFDLRSFTFQFWTEKLVHYLDPKFPISSN